ncbi:MAG TPA: L-threonylcarbamoyladenylate synthase [Gemmatimonadaceae bacterium]|nr:L-threonylcarbamoyladenylate synthase [Gemmatimonadaceae bacterium]
MLIRRVDPSHIDVATIEEAGSIIRRGGLVAFPTETVYGLGADATNAAAVGGIFAAKGRPSYNPLIVHVDSVAEARRWVSAWPDTAERLARAFWPGPLTLVLPKHPSIPDIVTAGLQTVGIRVPSHPVALALLRAAGRPIAAPSANRSMHVSPTLGEHVASSLGATPDMILDAGPASVGIESTVLDLSAAVPVILRPGTISRDALAALLGLVDVATGEKPAAGEAHRSPGMMDRHYSPAARVVLTTSPGVDAVIEAALREERTSGAKVVALSRAPVAEDTFAVWRMPDDPAEYARLLYATLHRVDAEGFTTVIVEAPPAGAAWDGIRDRLTRAAR